jgi:DNA adenine methylase
MDGLQPYVSWLVEGCDRVVDAFVGGGAVTVWLAAHYRDLKIVACDKDPFVAAFWQTISSTDDDVRRLRSALDVTPSLDLFDAIRDQMASPDALSTIQKAAFAVLDSRLSYSGIQNGGPQGGRHQAGGMKIGSRYQVQSVVRGVTLLHELLRGRFEAHETDAVEFIRTANDLPCFVDPPYVEKGPQLYRVPMSEEEHGALALALKGVECWVVTYDDHPLVWDLYAHAAIERLPVRYGTSRNEDGGWRGEYELVVTPGEPSRAGHLSSPTPLAGESKAKEQMREDQEMAMAA